jgi:hypothetical protein
VSYEIIEEKIVEAAFWIWDERILQKILDENPTIFKKEMAFNAASFLF